MKEMEKFIQIYAQTIQTVTDSMQQVNDLSRFLDQNT